MPLTRSHGDDNPSTEYAIPALTGDTTNPDYTVIYNSQYNTSYAGYMVFDQDINTNWQNADNNLFPQEVGVIITTPININELDLRGGDLSGNAYNPKDLAF